MSPLYPMQLGGGGFKGSKKQQPKKKINPLKEVEIIDYLDIKLLTRFTNDQGKLLPRRITGVTATQQRILARAVKYARQLALMPFVAKDVT